MSLRFRGVRDGLYRDAGDAERFQPSEEPVEGGDVEDVGSGGRVESFADEVWWSAATITTVGYGDIAPVTLGARLAEVVAMVGDGTDVVVGDVRRRAAPRSSPTW